MELGDGYSARAGVAFYKGGLFSQCPVRISWNIASFFLRKRRKPRHLRSFYEDLGGRTDQQRQSVSRSHRAIKITSSVGNKAASVGRARRMGQPDQGKGCPVQVLFHIFVGLIDHTCLANLYRMLVYQSPYSRHIWQRLKREDIKGI